MSKLPKSGELFLRPRLEAALARAGNTHTLADVVARCESGRARWWQSPDGRAVIVTELIGFPRLKTVNYWLVAGELEPCLTLVPAIEASAIREGCTRATGIGRPGFARLLGGDGVIAAGVAYRKELER